MKILKFRNEKGVSLVELLAALSLLGIAIALVSAVIGQISSNDRAADSISLNQEVNLLVSELRHQYYDGENKLCPHDSNVTINLHEESSGTMTDDCILVNDDTEAFSLSLTVINDKGDSIDISTSWNKQKPSVLHVNNEEEDVWEIIDDDDQIRCEYADNVELSGDLHFKHNFGCELENPYPPKQAKFIFMEDVKITGNIRLQNTVYLFIMGDLHIKDTGIIDGSHSGKNSGKICVDGTVYFPDGKSEKDYNYFLQCDKNS